MALLNRSFHQITQITKTMKYTLNKGVLLFISMLLLIGCSMSTEPKQHSSEDYKNAATFMSRSWYGLVQNQVVSQDWTGDTVLTYAKRTAEGTQFIAVYLSLIHI